MSGPRIETGKRGELPTLCWCKARIIGVAPEDIRNGRTGTCGRTGCQPPGEQVVGRDKNSSVGVRYKRKLHAIGPDHIVTRCGLKETARWMERTGQPYDPRDPQACRVCNLATQARSGDR